MSSRFAALALPTLICLGALAAPLAAHADASPAEPATPAPPAPAAPAAAAYEPAFRPIAGVLYTIGQGETAKASVVAADGTTGHVDLAGILDVYAGGEFPLAPNGLALQLTIGWHQSSSSNGISAHRIPLEAILMYPLSPVVRLGGGIRYPAHLRFSDGAAPGLTSTPGFLGVLEIKLAQHFALDLRYVEEQYQLPTSSSRLDASHFGAGISAIY
jgi:hypothetical protein